MPPKSTVEAQPGLDITITQSRREVLFARILEKPDDLDAAFEYAALSVQAGDLEAAVSTLERMLIFAPGLPRLQLELGVLYYRLGAYETARSYFEAAIAAPDVPAEVQAKVEQYLGGIDDAGKTTRFTGQVRAGIRYQTNANLAPVDGTTIPLNGLPPVVLDPGSAGEPDWNVYGAALLHLSHDLPSQGDTLEGDLVVYGSKQHELDELDTALAEVTLGPAFDLGRFGIENGAIGVYGIASGVFIEDEFYSAAGGVGTRLVLQPNPRLYTLTGLEYRYRDYHESSVAPTADDRDGSEFRAYTTANFIVSPSVVLNGTAYVQRTDAEADYVSYTEAGLSASASFSFAAPFGLGAAPWIISPVAGVIHREYDENDPLYSADVEQLDNEAFVGANLVIPATEEWLLLVETEYRDVGSNYAIRNYDNFSVAFSVVKRF